MAGFGMNADQEDYFDAIATFVEKYEGEHHAIDDAQMTPVELLRSLMDEHGMTESDLVGRSVLGPQRLLRIAMSGESVGNHYLHTE